MEFKTERRHFRASSIIILTCLGFPGLLWQSLLQAGITIHSLDSLVKQPLIDDISYNNDHRL